MVNRISKRYARALLNLALVQSNLEVFEEQLQSCSEILCSSKILFEALTNPENHYSSKVRVLDKLFGGSVNKEILNLLKLLIDNKRLDLLPDILTEFKKGAQDLANTLQATIVSAFPMSDEELLPIKKGLQEKYHTAGVNVEMQIDKSLLGGFKIVIGNEIIDKSFSGMLDTMKNQVLSR